MSHQLDPEERARLLSYFDADDSQAVNWDDILRMYARMLPVTEAEYHGTHYFGVSPIEQALRDRQLRGSNAWGGHAVSWSDNDYIGDFTVDRDGVVFRGIPRQEVDLSPEAMRTLWDSWTGGEAREAYGTSEHADPRGYWMPVDGQAS